MGKLLKIVVDNNSIWCYNTYMNCKKAKKVA
jgi:hypothetical protein